MPPRLEPGRSTPRKHPWVKVPPCQSVFVRICCRKEDIKGSPIHYVPGIGSVLCGRVGCAYCHLKEHHQWYAPVRQWIDPKGFFDLAAPWGDLKGEWVLRTLRITEHMEEILLEDHLWHIIRVYREANYRNAPLAWEVVETIPESRRDPVTAHDVEALVLACLGPRLSKKKVAAAPEGPVSRGEVNVEPTPIVVPPKFSTFDFHRIDQTKLPVGISSVELLMRALVGELGKTAFERAEKVMIDPPLLTNGYAKQ